MKKTKKGKKGRRKSEEEKRGRNRGRKRKKRKKKKNRRGREKRRKEEKNWEERNKPEKICPPLKANLLPAKLTHPHPSLPRKRKKGPLPYTHIRIRSRTTLSRSPSHDLLRKSWAYFYSSHRTPPAYPFHARIPSRSKVGSDPPAPPKPFGPSCLPCRGPGTARPMQLPSTKKVHPDALAYPSHLASLAAPAYPLSSTPLCTIRTRLPTLGRA